MVDRVLSKIDAISEWSGRTFMWMSLPLIAAITYDVTARYLFSAPTPWSYDVSYMLGGTLMVLGGAYTLLHHGHVRVDVLYNQLSTRGKLILDISLTIIFFFPLLSVLFYHATEAAIRSFATQEVSSIGVWEPIMWPFRFVFPVGIGLTLLQGISWFARNVQALAREVRP